MLKAKTLIIEDDPLMALTMQGAHAGGFEVTGIAAIVTDVWARRDIRPAQHSLDTLIQQLHGEEEAAPVYAASFFAISVNMESDPRT